MRTSITRRRRAGLAATALAAAVAVGVGLVPGAPALAQPALSVFVDDSPQAAEAISRARELNAIGNHDEAAAVLARLLAQQPDRVVLGADGQPAVTVRTAVNALIAGTPDLLEAYRRAENPRARTALDAGFPELVEREALLTTAGFDATLALAQRNLDHARFAAAWLTIEQLDRHPDREGSRGERAARLLASIAAYAGRGVAAPEDAALARRIELALARWQLDAGEPRPVWPDAAPAPPMLTGDHVFTARPVQADPSGALERPLASAVFQGRRAEAQRARTTDPRNTPEFTFVAPTRYGDLVLTNDGREITAFNRFTLAEEWALSVEAWSTNAGHGRSADRPDVNTVTVSDGVAVALTALNSRGAATDERVVVAVDAQTGTPLWRRTLWDVARSASDADDALRLGKPANEPEAQGAVARARVQRARFFDGAVLRGQPVIHEGTVVLTAVRQVITERLYSITLFGLDLTTGELRWVTPIGSAGLERRAASSPTVHAPTATGGLIVRGSSLGVTIALEAHNGRVRWLRTSPPAERFRRTVRINPFEAQSPVVRGDELVMLEADRSWIRRIDRWTGTQLAEIPASAWGSPNYLLGVGEALVAVDDTAVLLADPNARDGAPAAVRIADFNRLGTRAVGRVVPGDGRVFIPSDAGLLAADIPDAMPADDADTRAPRFIPLRHTGIALPSGDQIFVADGERVYVYSSWEAARDALAQRMAENPTDPRPAITFAELAVQARRTESILPAVDRSIDAIESDPLSPSMDRARAALFRAVLAMLDPLPPATPRAAPANAVEDVAVRGELSRRLLRIAGSPRERAAALLAAGAHAEAIDDITAAVDRYQEVLASPPVASAPHRPDLRGALPAGAIATRALTALIQTAGRAVYADYDAQADAELAALRARADVEAIDAERLAERYPVALAASDAWQIAAAIYTQNRRHTRATRALQRALDGAPDGQLAAITLRLVESLAAADRPRSAAQLALRLAAETRAQRPPAPDAQPDPDPTAPATSRTVRLPGGERRELDAAVETLVERTRDPKPRPAIGATLDRGPTLAEWRIQTLPAGTLDGAPSDVVLMNNGRGQVGVFASADAEPVQLWTRDINEAPLAIDADTLYTTESADITDPSARIVVARDLRTGEIRWRTDPFSTLFDDEPEHLRLEFQTPLRPERSLTELEYRFGPRRVVLADGAGRVAAFDRRTGALAWTNRRTASLTHDLHAAAGIVALVGGDAPPGRPIDQATEPDLRIPTLVVIEAATGEQLRRVTLDATPRWVVVSDAGLVIAGTSDGVTAHDPFAGEPVWRSEHRSLEDTLGGAALPGVIVVRDDEHRLWFIDADAGSTIAAPADVGNVMSRGFRSAFLHQLGHNTAVTSHRGTAIVDQTGLLVGLEEREIDNTAWPAAFARDHFVTVDASGDPAEFDPAKQAFGVEVRELPGARLVNATKLNVESRITAVAVIDGWVLLSTENTTVCLRAAP